MVVDSSYVLQKIRRSEDQKIFVGYFDICWVVTNYENEKRKKPEILFWILVHGSGGMQKEFMNSWVRKWKKCSPEKSEILVLKIKKRRFFFAKMKKVVVETNKSLRKNKIRIEHVSHRKRKWKKKEIVSYGYAYDTINYGISRWSEERQQAEGVSGTRAGLLGSELINWTFSS